MPGLNTYLHFTDELPAFGRDIIPTLKNADGDQSPLDPGKLSKRLEAL